MLGPLMMAALCACLGVAAGVRLQARAASLRAWQRSLFAMHAACAYARSTCAQVVRAGAAEVPQLWSIARQVELNGADAGKLFKQADMGRLLRHEERDVLCQTFAVIAGGSRAEMAAALQYAMQRFEGFCQKSEQKRDADARMYAALGVLSGICVFLILC